MKTRIIYPQLWLDEKFAQCRVSSKLLFMYLITSPYLGLSVYSRISDRKILFDTGLNTVQLAEAKKELEQLGWCVFKDEYIFHKHKCSYIDYSQNERVLNSKQKEIDSVPEEIKQYFNSFCLNPRSNSVVTPLQRNTKYKIQNTKQEGGVGETAQPGRAVAEHIISVFNQAMNKKYSLTEKRYELIRAREKSYGSEQLETACRNLGQSAFHTGKNDRNWVADPDWLFRNDENVDKALNLESKKPKQKTSSVMDLVKGLSANT